MDEATEGSTVDLPDGCLYREAVVIDKSLTLVGDAGGDPRVEDPSVEIRGSDVWSGWTQNGAGYWVKGTLPSFTSGDGRCKPDTSRCLWPEQVFFDGEPLVQVASNPEPGQFAVNDDRQVLLADDPTGHEVEVSVRDNWIIPRSDNVTIEGFTMKHVANSARSGGIDNGGNNAWRVANNDLSYSHGPIVSLGAADDLKAEVNDIHHGGRIGLSSSHGDVEVRGNKIHHNNIEDYRPSWSAGGIKISTSTRAVIDGNEVYNNDWNGIWTDVFSENITISNNRAHHNLKQGIHVEKSDYVEVSGNVVWENGWGVSAGGDGISASASRDVNIYDNTLAWNYAGVVIINSRRNGDPPKYSKVRDVLVHDNSILAKDYSSPRQFALAWTKTFAEGNLGNTAANNRGYNNRYYFVQPLEGAQKRYKWVDVSTASLTAFNQTRGEEQECYVLNGEGCYLTETEKDDVVADKDIPPNPER